MEGPSVNLSISTDESPRLANEITLAASASLRAERDKLHETAKELQLRIRGITTRIRKVEKMANANFWSDHYRKLAEEATKAAE